MAKNRYTRALKVLKNSHVDEKIQMLESLPTNNTTGLYVVDPAIINTVTIQGLERAADFTQDGDGGEDGDDGVSCLNSLLHRCLRLVRLAHVQPDMVSSLLQ